MTDEQLFKQISTKLDWLLNDMRNANHRIAQVTVEVIDASREAIDASREAIDASERLRRIEERLLRIEKSLDIANPESQS